MEISNRRGVVQRHGDLRNHRPGHLGGNLNCRHSNRILFSRRQLTLVSTVEIIDLDPVESVAQARTSDQMYAF